MNLPLFISKRYLLSKKSTNVINIISTISVVSVAFGAMALLVIISVFNGFETLIRTQLNSFDPDLKITLVHGKTFSADSIVFKKLENNSNDIEYFVEVLEENVLLEYDDKQYIAIMKGVDYDFAEMNRIDSMIIDGEFMLRDKDNKNHAIVGYGVAYYLSIGLNFITPIYIWAPKRSEEITFDAEKAFNRELIFPSGIFSIQQEYDNKYIIVPLNFARNLLEYTTEVSAIEIKLKENVNKKKAEKNIQEILGKGFNVKNRFEQQELLYKIMKSEKLAIFVILTFILIIASFNIIGSLTMLIIEKKKDISVLRSLGASDNLIRNIFLLEGWLIAFFGAVIGIFFGVIVCFLQQQFGLVQFPGSGTFIVSAYPVEMRFLDVLLVAGTVLLIGFIASWYPVRYITKKFIN